MSSCRWLALSILAVGASFAVAQQSSDSDSEANTPEDDGVLEFIREMREARARELVVDRTISVYSTHYTVGPLRFESIDQVFEQLQEYTPRNFPMMRLAECGARARMEELLARKAEFDRPFLERARAENRSYLYMVRIGTPNECPW